MTADLSRRYVFRTREARRAWMNPRFREAQTKYEHGGFVPVRFGRTNERRNVNVRGCDPWVVLDFDGLPHECGARLASLKRFTGEFFTTFSHGVKPGGRIRMVLELDRSLTYDRASGTDEITPARAAASYQVAELLGLDPVALDAAKIIDRLCWRPSQYFNVPCHDPKRPDDCFFATLDGGELLSVDELLERGRNIVGAAKTYAELRPGEYPEPTERDRRLAAEDLSDVCERLEAHRGPGFRYSWDHLHRLGGRIELGQLEPDETLDCLLLAAEQGLLDEADETGSTFDSAAYAVRVNHIREHLSKPYTHAGLLSSRLELGVGR
jgi:hypothetical protein